MALLEKSVELPGKLRYSPAPVKDHSDQWAILAGLRFVLAFVVFMNHTIPIAGSRLTDWFGTWNGRACVLAFMILSGYSIAHSLSREPKGYFIRRAARIFPLYWLGVALSAFAIAHYGPAIQFGASAIPAGKFWSHSTVATLLMVSPFVYGPIAVNFPSWTVAVEWWMYMAGPILNKTPTYILLALASISAAFYVWACQNLVGSYEVHSYGARSLRSRGLGYWASFSIGIEATSDTATC